MSAPATPATLPPARRLPAAAWGQMVLAETRMVVRDYSGLLVPVGFPLLLMVMNGLGVDRDVRLANGASVMDGIIMPMTVTMVLALVGLVNMPSFLSAYRRYGVLRRLAATPARPGLILLAQMVVSGAQVVLGIGLMLAVGTAFLGVGIPGAPWWALGVGVLVLLAMYGVGTLVAALAPSVNAALALGLGFFFLTLALGGGLGPLAALPDALQEVGRALPYGAGHEALAAAWAGATPAPRDLLVLGAWSLGAGGLAARFFRWS